MLHGQGPRQVILQRPFCDPNIRNLIPGLKIGVDSFIKVCDIDAFDSIITDWDCVEDQIAAIKEKGIEITVVEESK